MKTSDSRGYYTIRDENLTWRAAPCADSSSGSATRPGATDERTVLREGLPLGDGVLVEIAIDWLERSPRPFREQIASSRGGGPSRSPTVACALRGVSRAQERSAPAWRRHDLHDRQQPHRQLDFGRAAFKFSGAPEPILINVNRRELLGSGRCQHQLRPEQPGVSPIERGGRMMNVMIPGYKYTLKVECASKSDGGALGTILHPSTKRRFGMWN